MRKRIFPVAAVMLLLCVAASAAEFEVTEDILFSKPGGFELKGDLYVPGGEGPFPGVLYLHGGGFVAGSKSYHTQVQVIENLARNGFIVFSADYRLLSQNGIFPNNIKDAKCALCWLRKHGPEHGMEPGVVGVLGESAGGYLAAMIAVTQGVEEFAPECEAAQDAEPTVLAAVAAYTPADFTKMKNNLSKLLLAEIKRATGIRKKKEVYRFMVELSPVTYVENAVPILLMHGKEDVLVPVEQSRIFSSALEQAKKDYEYEEFEQAPHGFMSDYYGTDAGQAANQKAVEFFKKYLVAERDRDNEEENE